MEDDTPTAETTADKFNAKYAPWMTKYDYQPVFGVPDDPWRVDANWDDAYYRAAEATIKGVVEGQFRPAIEGIAGVFLFRHYLELALKYLILHARKLEGAGTIAAPEEREDVRNIHNLASLWDTAMRELNGKIPDGTLKEYDVEFARKMIMEFHEIDRKGVRFRYHGDKFGANMSGEPMTTNSLYIDYGRLLGQMDHAREVLSALDTYVYELHGELVDWEAEMSSW